MKQINIGFTSLLPADSNYILTALRFTALKAQIVHSRSSSLSCE